MHARGLPGPGQPMGTRLVLLVLLAAFVVVATSTAVPLAQATCTTGGVNTDCLKSTNPRCGIVELPRCEPYP